MSNSYVYDGHSFNDCEETEDPNALTGLEEHLHDEAYECGEFAAAREEANHFHAMEASMYEAELAWEAAEDLRLHPGGRCDGDNWGFGPRCETSEDAAVPF